MKPTKTSKPKPPLAHCRLYGFVDMGYINDRDAVAVMEQMAAGGIDIVQLRDKRGDVRETLALARQLQKLADVMGVWFIVNDFVDIARQAKADGVHLGQEDLIQCSVAATRDILGKDSIIGVSTHSLEQATEAERMGADYIGVGPIFPTATKPGVGAVGVELVTRVRAAVYIPFFAIGGIHRGNVAEVVRAGAHAVAVVSDILCSSDIGKTTSDLKKVLDAVAV